MRVSHGGRAQATAKQVTTSLTEPNAADAYAAADASARGGISTVSGMREPSASLRARKKGRSMGADSGGRLRQGRPGPAHR